MIVPIIPRQARPHTITLRIPTGEEDINFNKIYENHDIKYVRVMLEFGLNQSNSGIKPTSQVLVVIDTQDYKSDLELNSDTFNTGDVIIFQDKEYVINDLKPYTDVQGIVHSFTIGLNSNES